MPLRAELDGEDIFSFDYTENEWKDLKSCYKNRNLLLPCCRSSAIPKTSRLGNRFFSHLKTGDCEYKAESPEHLYLKMLVAQSAKRTDWKVYTEWPGRSPDGNAWIADVFCTKNNIDVAFEIQLSYQSLTTTSERQARYKASGVRCAWFVSPTKFKPSYLKPNKEIPFFAFDKVKVGHEPRVFPFKVEVGILVEGILNKRLRWDTSKYDVPEKSHIEDYEIYVLPDICWKCKKEIKQIYGWGIGVYYDQAKTVPNASSILEEIASWATNDMLLKAGANLIGRVDFIKGKRVNYPYVNLCLHCRAVQNNYYLMTNLQRNSHSQDLMSQAVTVGRTHIDSPKRTRISSGWVFDDA